VATRSLLLAAGVLVVGSWAGAQPLPAQLPAAPVVPSGGVVPGLPPLVPSAPPALVPQPQPGELIPPTVTSVPPIVPTAPAEKSIEQLLKELEGVQAQKADLLKREADLKAAVQKKLESIQKQVDKLGAGGAPGANKADGPNLIRRVELMGFADRDEKEVNAIVAKAGLVPGGLLTKPMMDAVQGRLAMAGFPGVSFEVIRPEPAQPQVADIRLHAARGER
jgi:hypothetical protein